MYFYPVLFFMISACLETFEADPVGDIFYLLSPSDKYLYWYPGVGDQNKLLTGALDRGDLYAKDTVRRVVPEARW